jgi:signal transduction histidine kinase
MGKARLRLQSTTARIAIALLLVQLASVGVTLIILQNATERSIKNGTHDFVSEMRTDLIEIYNDDGRADLTKAIARRVRIMGTHDAVIGLISKNGVALAGNLANWPVDLAPSPRWHVVSLRRTGDSAPVEMTIAVTLLPDQSLLVTGNTLAEEQRLRDAGRQAFLYALLLGLLLSALGSYLLAHYIGRKITTITKVADQVAGGNLTQRIILDGSDDAFDRLSLAINNMLSRVETLVSELRLITDSLAHDLRSPVARMKANIERAIQGTRDPSTLLALGNAGDEADSLSRMLTTAIQISRAEAGLGRDQFQTFPISEMLGDLAEVYGPLAEDNGFTIRCIGNGQIEINAHRELLGQAIANLIDNALKYAIGADGIILSAEKRGSQIEISVADNGPGIAAERRVDALKRFGRLDAARQASGAGLGLSLVATVAHLHSGQLILEDNRPGLRAILTLPI